MVAKKVLSIQSHVVHGYVGNKAATFPLQCKGWDVDALNTVQFSNHPAYGFASGFRSNGVDLENIVRLGLLQGLSIEYSAVLTGYLPDIDGLQRIGKVVTEMCERDGNLKWILDPVLGDEGRLYVPEETVEIYKNILRNGAIYLTTPNQFELELLTETKIEDLPSLKSAMQRFHILYPKVVNLVVTSVILPLNQGLDNFVSAGTDFKDYWYFLVPKIKAHFSGGGDLFSAIILDILLGMEKIDLRIALNGALSLVDCVLKKTYELSNTADSDSFLNINDLKLIQCKSLFRNPPPSKFTSNRF